MQPCPSTSSCSSPLALRNRGKRWANNQPTMTLTNKTVFALAVLAAVGLGAYFALHVTKAFGAGTNGGSLNDAFTASSTAILIGGSNSRVILPAYSNRAWAMIQQPENAT